VKRAMVSPLINPFQWSEHILYKDGSLVHKGYLCDDDRDPREDLTRTLLDALGEKGTIFIYTTYEKTIIERFAEHLPQYRDDLLRIPNRFKDLCAIIRHYFYHPGFHGSFSLKSWSSIHEDDFVAPRNRICLT
jgi:hypothetical protein